MILSLPKKSKVRGLPSLPNTLLILFHAFLLFPCSLYERMLVFHKHGSSLTKSINTSVSNSIVWKRQVEFIIGFIMGCPTSLNSSRSWPCSVVIGSASMLTVFIVLRGNCTFWRIFQAF